MEEHSNTCGCCCGNPSQWGILLIVIGIIWYFWSVGALSFLPSIWPVVFVIFGAYLLFTKMKKN